MSLILVVNSGSSSIKYQLIDAQTEQWQASGLIERIGESMGRAVHRAGSESTERELPIRHHRDGFRAMIAAFEREGQPLDRCNLSAVGHRVVQGGSEFVEPALIDDEVAAKILDLAALAPLHNPGHYQAIAAAREAFPKVPHVAVFDTAFHQSMPPAAYTYAIDAGIASAHGIRRYGFHGTSHQVVAQRAADFLNKPIHSLKQIVLHLGNGASACAINAGRSVATSMGLTPLEGLVMGTRSGDLDPGVILHLLRRGFSVDELDELLNKRSGLVGLAGSNDMRDVRAAADAGSGNARLALDVYARRIRHYVGAYLVELGAADALIFTAGVGENHAPLRAEVCAGLEMLGIEIDTARNASPETGPRRISSDASRVEVLVVPTDEEAEIARQSWQLVSGSGAQGESGQSVVALTD
ncbi:acetate/propionate family kinase [Leucobacter sp. W1478]|uniref:acetate/propionate family kinase n=1 Tax=Leucobacter sp. W1478 TaxID=3439065 RepID=UPI003F303E82